MRDSLEIEYRNRHTEAGRTQVLEKAKSIFLSVLVDDIFSSWYGTNWDFYGATDTPRRGAIACGYFVTTALRDAGVRIDRVALAKCASETMIRNLVGREHITSFRGISLDEFVAAMVARGDGLYILGLDWHTGFLLCEKGKAYFIHSFPPGVKREQPSIAPYLAHSKYRVAGSITSDKEFFKRWILQLTL